MSSTTTAPTVKPLVLIVGSDEIMKSIKSIATRGKALDESIHLTACSILAHVHQHREVSLMNKLITAMPKSARKNAIIDWCTTFGEMAWDGKQKAVVFVKDSTTYQDKAEACPFWSFKPEPEYHAVDLDAAIAKLVKQAIKRQEEIEEKRKTDADYSTTDNIKPETLAALKALAPAA